MRLVWIKSVKGPEAQLWADDYSPLDKKPEFLQETKIWIIHQVLSLDEIKKLYPLRENGKSKTDTN